MKRWMMLVAVGLLAVTVACAGAADGTAEVEATDDDAEMHDDAGHTDAEMDDDAEMHDDAEANAYLEVAAKDRLFLISMTNFAFTPDVLEAEAGEVIEIAVQNVESVLHDFTIDRIDADLHISYLGGTGQHLHDGEHPDADVHFVLSEPGTGVVHIKVHEPGEYIFYCTVPGHRELGMEGTLIVR